MSTRLCYSGRTFYVSSKSISAHRKNTVFAMCYCECFICGGVKLNKTQLIEETPRGQPVNIHHSS